MTEKQQKTGTLYGIGVGPGSPDLITLRAAATLARVDVVLAAASPRNDDSLALSIARGHLPPDVEILRLDFPMTRDRAVLEAAWQENAETSAQTLLQGKNAAFITLGDPLIYSTFGYLMRTLQKGWPELPIEVVSGVTSYQAAAAASRTVLCESGENLLLLPGINEGAELGEALKMADNAAILKCYKNFPAIKEALGQDASARNKESLDIVFSSRLGLEGEITSRNLQDAPENPHYLSLVLATKPRR